MSDFEDDYDDDFDLGDYFFVEETYDEVGDLAEHAYPSPPPIDYDEDEVDWDRFNYWNDIEYDSDGYHDVNAERIAKRKRKNAQSPPKGPLKRRADSDEGAVAKRRKTHDGTAQLDSSSSAEAILSPIAWRQQGRALSPVTRSSSKPFALLKDWRSRFPEAAPSGSATAVDKDEDDSATEIDLDVLLTALRNNLGKITGGPMAGGLGADEGMLLQHITKMLTEEGLSADDVAGQLADTLFARDDASVTSDAVDDRCGDGDFEQWVLGKAQERAQLSGSAKAGAVELESSGKDATMLVSPPQTLPAGQRPPTPSSTETGSSQKVIDEKPVLHDSPIASAATAGVVELASDKPVEARSRKRKADTSDEAHTKQAAPKRVATRAFAAPTASSRSKHASVDTGENVRAKRGTRASKK